MMKMEAAFGAEPVEHIFEAHDVLHLVISSQWPDEGLSCYQGLCTRIVKKRSWSSSTPSALSSSAIHCMRQDLPRWNAGNPFGC